MDLLIEIIKQNPLLYAFFIIINSLFIGAGIGFGLYKGIDKLFDIWVAIRVNTDEIPALINLNKEHKQDIKEVKKILERHDLEVQEIRSEIRKVLDDHDENIKEELKKIS